MILIERYLKLDPLSSTLLLATVIFTFTKEEKAIFTTPLHTNKIPGNIKLFKCIYNEFKY